MRSLPRFAPLALSLIFILAAAAEEIPQLASETPRNGERPEFVRIPAGTFLMGSPTSERDRSASEGPQHEVSLRSFRISAGEITQKQWRELMPSNPSYFKGDDLPVECVTWFDAIMYCNARSMREGLVPCYTINGTSDLKRWIGTGGPLDSLAKTVECDFMADGYRLPTEAEWEYACRAGTTSAVAFGENLSSVDANFNGNSPYGNAPRGPNLGMTADTGSYPPNAWGLHDMHGNVWEWCWDWYDPAYFSTAPKENPTGPKTGKKRSFRGGAWYYFGRSLRSAYRNAGDPEYANRDLGFRIVKR